MEEFEIRLTKEKDELLDKVMKLENFFSQEHAPSIERAQISLMSIQLDAMKAYLKCITRRIELLK